MQKLTAMQQKIYDYIANTVRNQGYPPSVREIGEAVGLKSPSTVHFHIKHLEDFPELAYDNDNLISLCSACHRKRHPEKGANGMQRYSRVSAYGAGEQKRPRKSF